MSKRDDQIKRLKQLEAEARARGDKRAANKIRGMLKHVFGAKFDPPTYHETKRIPPKYNPNGPN